MDGQELRGQVLLFMTVDCKVLCQLGHLNAVLLRHQAKKRMGHKAGKVVHAVVLPWKELQMAHQFLVYISGHVLNAGISYMWICNQIRTNWVNERAIRE